MDNSEFGKLFNYLCIQKGQNDSSIASHLKVDRATIGRWRKGERTPKLSLLPAISDFFGIDLQIFALEHADEAIHIIDKKIFPTALDNALLEKYHSLSESNRKLVDKFIDSLLNKYPYGYDPNINYFTDPDGARVYLKQNNQLLPTMGEKPHELTDDDVCALATEYYNICKS